MLVTGPARSGKSEWAEQLARDSHQSVRYVATAQADADDPEWQAKIARHIQRRPADWQTLAVPLELAAPFADQDADCCWLVDSLGTWTANGLALSAVEWDARVTEFLAAIALGRGTVILVAEETGWGVVPAYPLGRQFRDRLGHLTRRVGAIATAVYLVTGGYAIDLVQLGQPLPQGAVEDLS
ncbi:MAG: bifunctional adenosylcobinamide kinase/adenosylcobinamide-phosphate guanylyltransferase [Spirulinaceae cyanobacterium SM2_1_0]|nr:bifunctional adenosylcobinamide kinase/adenosylcobinamide-phosphate guanylyltransferase [Spirulinaceae cyanobacterium SM2_1_0]